MAFAAVQAVGDILVLLPMRTQLFLEIVRICKLRNILELINANDNFKSLFLCNLLGKVKYLIRVLLYSLPIKID